MTDELEKAKTAFRDGQPVVPREAAKKRAIANAMAAFDEKNALAGQGTRLGDRLRDMASAVYETLIGRRSMKLTPALAGGWGPSWARSCGD